MSSIILSEPQDYELEYELKIYIYDSVIYTYTHIYTHIYKRIYSKIIISIILIYEFHTQMNLSLGIRPEIDIRRKIIEKKRNFSSKIWISERNQTKNNRNFK